MSKTLKDLSTPLRSDQIEFRVAELKKSKDGKRVFAHILAYKNSRTDMQVLDEVAGPANWQLRFHEGKDSVVAALGVRADGQGTIGEGDFVWKEGNGTPGNFEKEKGAYSDAQKRAGFQWGIGRGLYDFPVIFVELFEGEFYEKDGKVFAGYGLKPNEWAWTVSYDKDGSVKELKADYKSNSRFNYKAK